MAEPVILAFDTSGPHCCAAVLSGDTVRAAVCEDMARGQAERLMGLLEELLAEAGFAWADLDRIGVGIGPGNFTGIRISVAAARGLALGLGIPAVGVSLFETTQVLGNWAQTCVPAPRGQVYWLDPDKQTAPVMAADLPDGAFVSSADYAPLDHVSEMARIAARRAIRPDERPAPLYIRPADAAPPKDPAPVILP